MSPDISCHIKWQVNVLASIPSSTYTPPVPILKSGFFGVHIYKLTTYKRTYVSLERCEDKIQFFVRFENEILLDETLPYKDVLLELSDAEINPTCKFIFHKMGNKDSTSQELFWYKVTWTNHKRIAKWLVISQSKTEDGTGVSTIGM